MVTVSWMWKKRPTVCIELLVWMKENEKKHEDVWLPGTMCAQMFKERKSKIATLGWGGIDQGGLLEKEILKKWTNRSKVKDKEGQCRWKKNILSRRISAKM